MTSKGLAEYKISDKSEMVVKSLDGLTRNYHNYLVSSRPQALTQLENVCLYPSHVRIEEI